MWPTSVEEFEIVIKLFQGWSPFPCGIYMILSAPFTFLELCGLEGQPTYFFLFL